ncbi:ornithine cyclodeaminase family protein [Massilia sp. W12]|uniref:ornithine cyclodeaminase family protein n=1 Tax=Massilia sp. W12 TaxID=3126507 RepID=UPI0030CE8B87
MQIVDAQGVNRVLQQAGWPALLAALRQGFAAARAADLPQRQLYGLPPHQGQENDCFAVLPAWNEEGMAVKAFTHMPQNSKAGYPLLHSQVLLFARAHGQPLALLDGASVTLWRTAAVSALAAQLLARPQRRRMLLLGTGRLAAPLVCAHLASAQLEQVWIWGRDPAKAQAAVQAARAAAARLDLPQPVAQIDVLQEELAPAVAAADLVVCATAAPAPLVSGLWLHAGSHLDLLGNHAPNQRECDSSAVTRSQVWVDSKKNVLAEAGEILLPCQEGVFAPHMIAGELSDLCSLRASPRESGAQERPTLFKSVGAALADLLTAQFIHRHL